MKVVISILFVVAAVVLMGCEQSESQINVRPGIKSDSLTNNIVTRPVAYAFSALIGEGIEIKQATTRRNDAGILELHINGYNRSYNTRRFRYRVEWLDEDGFMIQNKASVWLPASAMGKSPFSLKAVAPTPKATDFRMDTKKLK